MTPQHPVNKAKQRLNTLNDMLKLTLSAEVRLKLSDARDKLSDALLKVSAGNGTNGAIAVNPQIKDAHGPT